MKMKRISALILAGLLSVCMCVPAFAATQDSAGNIFEADSNVSLPSVPFFGAFAAGNSVTMNGSTAKGSVLAAGRSVYMSGSSVGESVYAAAESVQMYGVTVNGNIYAAANDIDIDAETVGNGVYATGNVVSFGGTANGFYASADRVVLSGTINGDASIEANQVEIADSAIVTGILKVKSPAEPIISGNAELGNYSFEQVQEKESDGGSLAKLGLGALIFQKITSGLYWIVAMALFGLLLCWLFGDHLDRSKEFIRTRTAPMIVTGIVSFFAIPIALLILCCTVILAPMAGMILLAYILLLCAGTAFTGASLGRLVFPKMNVFLSATIGIAILEVALLIPILGTIVAMAVDMYLLGYVIQNRWCNRLQKKAAAAETKQTADQTETNA